MKNSNDPDRAMMFLNLIYSDKDLINLIDYCIEGKHYVDRADGTITYPDGVDPTTSGYSNLGWMWGDQFLTYVWQGNPRGHLAVDG